MKLIYIFMTICLRETSGVLNEYIYIFSGAYKTNRVALYPK